MTETTVSLRVNKKVHEAMKIHDEINWSAVLRKSIEKTLEQLHDVDKEKARAAAQIMDTLRLSGAFSKGKQSGEILKEWREKRRSLMHR